MSDYPVGTVATATVRGVKGVRVIRERYGPYGARVGWWVPDPTKETGGGPPDHEVTDVRPLIVLDIDDPRGFARWLRDGGGLEGDVAESVAKQIEAQTRPPRIAEPGLWGVVEAHAEGIPRRRWVHHEEDRWVCDTGERRYWGDLADPELVREGMWRHLGERAR